MEEAVEGMQMRYGEDNDPNEAEDVEECYEDYKNEEDGDNEDGKCGSKHRHRSTKDAEGRNHKCSFCSKTYLSYPALYTHLKNKHAKGPDGHPVAAINAGRGRGRPKKSLGGG